MDGIVRNTAFALLAQITTAVFTAALTLYLVRALGPDGFGIFALALGIGSVTALLSDGIPSSAERFLAEARGDRSAVTQLLADALRLNLLISAIVALALFASAGAIAAAYDEPELVWPLRGIAVAVFAQTAMRLYLSAFIALARIAVNLRLIFLESIVEAASSVALVALGAGAAGAAFGRAAGYLFGAFLAVVVVVRLYGRPAVRLRSAPGSRTREIAGYAAPLLVTGAAYTLYGQADVLIIGALLSTTAVGLFTGPLRLLLPLGYLGQAVANSIAPRQAARDRRSIRALETGIRWMVIFQAMLLAPVIVWADPIVRLLLGGEFQESADVLRVLAPWIFLRGVSPLISNSVNYLGQAARRIPIVVAALAINVVIDVTLLPVIGVVAAAIGTGVAYCVYVPAHFRIVQRELNLSVRPLVLTFARAMLAAVLMGVVMFVVGTDTLSMADWLIGGIGGTLAFVGALLLTGEVSRGEIRRGLAMTCAQLSQLARRG